MITVVFRLVKIDRTVWLCAATPVGGCAMLTGWASSATAAIDALVTAAAKVQLSVSIVSVVLW